MVVVGREGRTLYYGCSEPASGEPPFKVANAMDLVQSYRERDEDHCVCMHLNCQFSISPYWNRTACSTLKAGTLCIYIYTCIPANCAILISRCSFSNYRWMHIICKFCQSCKLSTGEVCCIHCIQWTKEIVNIFSLLNSQFMWIQMISLPNPLLNIDPETNTTYTST